jgi:hypothetical protein
VEELGKEDTGKREWDSPLCAALRNGGAGEGGHRAEAVGLASMCPQERTHTNTHKHAFLARTLKQATSAEHDERKGDGRVVGPRGCRAGGDGSAIRQARAAGSRSKRAPGLYEHPCYERLCVGAKRPAPARTFALSCARKLLLDRDGCDRTSSAGPARTSHCQGSQSLPI